MGWGGASNSRICIWFRCLSETVTSRERSDGRAQRVPGFKRG